MKEPQTEAGRRLHFDRHEGCAALGGPCEYAARIAGVEKAVLDAVEDAVNRVDVEPGAPVYVGNPALAMRSAVLDAIRSALQEPTPNEQ